MKILTEEAIKYMRDNLIYEDEEYLHAFDVFINSLEPYQDKVKRDMDLFVASVEISCDK
jgi:hypothetical protein